MNKKKIILFIGILIIVGIAIYFIFFHKNTAKNLKIGNNTTSQEIVNYILDINSYEVQIEVEVTSNKNKNKYKMKQKYIKPDMITQEIIEPENIKGIKLIKNKNQLKIENSNLNLTKIIENYEFREDNCLDLISFIEEYKKNENANFEEKENEIILQVECKNANNNSRYRTLTLDKKTGNPTKMEIKDASKKTTVYILYNEVKLNNLQENTIAFNRLSVIKEI